MKSVAHVAPVAMTAVVHVQVPIVLHLAVPVVRLALMLHRLMAATNPQRLVVPMQNPPLSAYAQSPRQLQQLTVKENNYVATRSSQIPQRAKGPQYWGRDSR
jgi:hypothetical protein